jgi:hypothetical protein
VSGHDDVLTETLAFAVPLWIAEFRRLDPGQRQVVASRSAKVIAAQGDTLMFGSKAAFGDGAREMAAHQAHGRVKAGEELTGKCRACTRGQASYSAGEVFNELARGLACAAFQPGGVRFAGLSWCAAHPRERWADGPVCPACLRDERGPVAEPGAAKAPRQVERVLVAGGVL